MYNATNHFIDRHTNKTSGGRVAYTDHAGDWTYHQFGAHGRSSRQRIIKFWGLKAEQRVLMCMTDSVWFPAVFWGAIKFGAVPVPVNTMLTGTDYAYMLHDSCAHVWWYLKVCPQNLPPYKRSAVSGRGSHRWFQHRWSTQSISADGVV
ncbi:MAG: hypothetical protein Ct9H300mP14_01480 [Gammaproteobacteria bacterium]|nr:MAG: hypothetical protein Ct9H300mP14_01480 [Gammaproteobacteria bacterium]